MSLDLSHPVGTCRPCWPCRRHNVMTFLRTELFFFSPSRATSSPSAPLRSFMPFHVWRLTWQHSVRGDLQTARSAFIPDHEWAVVDKHVGDATDCPVLAEGSQRRRWEREEMSLLVVCAVTQELQIVGVHLQLCRSMWKSLQAPDFYGSCGKMQSQRCESWMERLHVCSYSSKNLLAALPSSCSFGHMEH